MHDYNSFPYIFKTDGDLIVDSSYIDTKRTIVAIGHDIRITENIISPEHAPIALIALSNGEMGGNIIIEDSVTDIEATLIAERGVIGSKDSPHRQLYIHGSVLSMNVLGAGECPYFISDTAECEKYNLSLLRHEYIDPAYGALNPRAQEFRHTPVIIEYDSRIISDPPPGLQDIHNP